MNAGDPHIDANFDRRAPLVAQRAIRVPGPALALLRPREPNAGLSGSTKEQRAPRNGTTGEIASHPGNARRPRQSRRLRDLRRALRPVSGRARLERQRLLPGGRRDGRPTRVRTDMWRGVTPHLHPDRAQGRPRRARLRLAMRARRADAGRASVWCSATTARRSCRCCALFGRKIFTNMDGIEWKRPKWSLPVRAWFCVNEWIAAWTSQRLVADHPGHRRPSRDAPARAAATVVIPYGGDADRRRADRAARQRFGLEPGPLSDLDRPHRARQQYRDPGAAPSRRRRRGVKLVVLGKLEQDNAYHDEVRAAASDEVIFPGAIYDPASRALAAPPRARLSARPHGRRHQSLAGRGAVGRQRRHRA